MQLYGIHEGKKERKKDDDEENRNVNVEFS